MQHKSGSAETEGVRPLAQAVRQVQQQHPGIHFHFFSGDCYDVTEWLDRGLVDFGTLLEPVDVSKYDSLRLPRPDVWGLLMRKDNPLAAHAAIRPSDLKGVPLIPSRQLAGENGLSGWLGYDYEALNIVATGNLINNLVLLAQEGVGCVFTLDGLADLVCGKSLCFRPLEPRMESWMYIVWKKYPVFSRPAEFFLTQLRRNFLAGTPPQGG